MVCGHTTINLGNIKELYDMEFQKLNAPSLKELFISELENMIISGKLPIGTKLPSERELATSMQVSRAVVNSGIAELEKKGFVVVKPRIGTFVEDYRRNGTMDTLVSIMKYNGGSLSNDEIRSILEVRILFMSLAARLTIEKAADAEIEGLTFYLEKLKNAVTPEDAATSIFEFSHELSFISGNMLLPLFFISFRDLVCSLWVRYARKYSIEELYQSALSIYNFVRTRDTDGALNYIETSTTECISGNRTIY